MMKILVVLIVLCGLSDQLSRDEAREILQRVEGQNFMKDFNFTDGESNKLVFNTLDLKNNDRSIEIYTKQINLP